MPKNKLVDSKHDCICKALELKVLFLVGLITYPVVLCEDLVDLLVALKVAGLEDKSRDQVDVDVAPATAINI